MLRKANNVFGTILSDVTIATTALPAVGDVVTNDNLPANAVVMVDGGNRRTTLAGLADGYAYHIVQGRGPNAPLMKSAEIEKGTETISIQKHVPAQQQVTVIGYNGVAGVSLPSANDTSYYVKVQKRDNDEGNRSQPMSLFGQYQTGGAATVTETAFGLAKNLVVNFRREAPATNGYLAVEVLSDGTITALANDANVVSGSNVVVSTAHTLTAGAFVNLAGATYQVKEVPDANTLVLSTPYVGATGTIIAGTTLATEAGSVTGITETGLRLSGVESKFDVVKFRNYFSNRFTATFSDKDVPVTHVQGARNGSGVWQEVAMDEYLNYGYEGQNEMIATPPQPRDMTVKMPGVGTETELTSKYSTINIKWKTDIDYLVSSSNGEGNVIVHLNLADDSGSGILDTATANTGETLAAALGLTPADLDE
jgi:hypothetical protein